jgi:hypothetical protein
LGTVPIGGLKARLSTQGDIFVFREKRIKAI